MNEVGIGLIGTGFMGKCHALAYGSVKATFATILKPRLVMLCDIEETQAKQYAEEFGFERWTSKWQTLINDPDVEIVSITSPNAFHKDMALAAILAGKVVYCEKPLSINLEDAVEMAEASKAAKAKTLVGYNYLRNPAIIHARKLIEDGAIGRILQFRGFVDEDYMADETIPYTWRCRIKEAGTGALGDLAVHLISVARYLVSEIEAVCGDIRTVHADRPDAEHPGQTGHVENEDQANALLRFKGGVQGTLSASRVAWGRKGYLAWEIHGSHGMLRFDQERMNELYLYQTDDNKDVAGFKTILNGPSHPPYGLFTPAPGHGLGFNDLKVIEVAHLLKGITGEEKLYPDFEDALQIEKVIHGIVQSSMSKRWVELDFI